LAIYAFPPSELADLIQAKMDSVFDSNASLGDTRDIIGGASLYPPHITIKGAFRLLGNSSADRLESALHLSKALERLAATTGVLTLRTNKLESYPEKSLSIMFDDPSIMRLRELQALVIPIVDEVRAQIIEPNYQASAEDETLLKHGEPQTGVKFIPHITVVGGKPGGISSPNQLERVRELLGEDWYDDWTFDVDKIGLLYETRFNGCWEMHEHFPLQRS